MLLGLGKTVTLLLLRLLRPVLGASSKGVGMLLGLGKTVMLPLLRPVLRSCVVWLPRLTCTRLACRSVARVHRHEVHHLTGGATCSWSRALGGNAVGVRVPLVLMRHCGLSCERHTRRDTASWPGLRCSRWSGAPLTPASGVCPASGPLTWRETSLVMQWCTLRRPRPLVLLYQGTCQGPFCFPRRLCRAWWGFVGVEWLERVRVEPPIGL